MNTTTDAELLAGRLAVGWTMCERETDLDEPLERLESHGFIQTSNERTGGRPSKIIHLNPHAQKAQKAQKASAT